MAAMVLTMALGVAAVGAVALGCVLAFTDWIALPPELARLLGKRARSKSSSSSRRSSARRSSARRLSSRRSSKGLGSVDMCATTASASSSAKKFSVFGGIRRRQTAKSGSLALAAESGGDDRRASRAANAAIDDHLDDDALDGGALLSVTAALDDGDDNGAVDLDDSTASSASASSSSGRRRRGKRSKARGHDDADVAALAEELALADDGDPVVSRTDSNGRASKLDGFMSGAMRGMGALAAAPVVVGAVFSGLASDGAGQLGRRGRGLPNMPSLPSLPSFRARRLSPAASSGGSRDDDVEDGDAEDDGSERGPGRRRRRDGGERQRTQQRRKPSAPALGARLADQLDSHPLLKSVLKPHADLTTAAAFSPTGQYVATAGGAAETSVRLLVRATLYRGEALTRFQTAPVPVRDWVASLAFSQDGFFLAAGTGNTSQVCVFRVFGRVSAKPALECVFQTHHAGPVRHLYMNTAPGEDAHFIATGASEGDASLRFWSFGPKPRMLFKHSLRTHFGELAQMRFSASGKLLAVVGGDTTAAAGDAGGAGAEADEQDDASGDGDDGGARAERLHLRGGGAGPLGLRDTRMVVYSVQFAQRGGFRKHWTVSGLQQTRVPAEQLDGVADVDFGARSSAAALLRGGADWQVARVKDARLAPIGAYEGPVGQGAEPFSAVALCESRRMVVAARGADLYFFRMPRDGGGEAPGAARLVEVVRKAHDSRIRRVMVAPDDEYVMTLAVNSRSARLWNFPTGTRDVAMT